MGFEKISSRVASSSTAQQETMTTIKSNNFARTCSLFSQFLKESRSFGDVGLLLSEPTNVEIVEKKSLDLFPLTSSSFTIAFQESSTKDMAYSRNSSNSTKEDPKRRSASMTIIYEGKVIVIDDLQEEMAQEIMSLASEGHKNNANTITSHYLTNALSHLPIQRAASLHRFMEKRKHRIAASAPYQLNNLSSRKQLCKQQEEHQLELKLG